MKNIYALQFITAVLYTIFIIDLIKITCFEPASAAK